MLLLGVVGCQSATTAFCDDWGQRYCVRVFECTVEQSQTREPFLSEYGHSERECAARLASQCEAQNACMVPATASSLCLQATTAMQCDQLVSTRQCALLCL